MSQEKTKQICEESAVVLSEVVDSSLSSSSTSSIAEKKGVPVEVTDQIALPEQLGTELTRQLRCELPYQPTLHVYSSWTC